MHQSNCLAGSAGTTALRSCLTSLRTTAFLFAAGIALAALGNLAAAATLDAAVQKKVQAATFEVVLPKPVDDPLTYEKALPLELLPYQFRTDKYFSVGTAFAIGGGHYVTAGHVLAIAIGGLWGAPALRDTSGHVFAVAQIEKYSEQEDFVQFTLADQPAHAPALEVNTKPVLNDVVYSVGNALGEGVVIRDGLYTSDTPENQDGRWKWLRFSAAASPGNSGGPLLDKNGKVIGIVLMKSPNENLNYAVSIAQVVNAPAHLARIDTRGESRLDIFDKVKTLPFKQEFSLPRYFADFAATFTKLRDEYETQGQADLLADNLAETFPQGQGSDKLLHAAYERTLPALIVRAENGTWTLDSPRYAHADLGDGGSIDSARIKSQTFLHLRKPDNVDTQKLFADPAQYMQLTLKGLALYRQVGPEKVKITSLATPSEDSAFVDAWGRPWRLRVWPMAYDNTLLISLDLPVPDGYVSMRRTVFAGSKHLQVQQMKALADFVCVSYGGTPAQWQEFLGMEGARPPGLSPAMIHFDFGSRFEYQSQRLSFSYGPELQRIDKDNQLRLDFGLAVDAGKTIWDVTGIAIHEESESKTEVGAFRHSATGSSSEEALRKEWDKRVQHLHPYDAVSFEDDGKQYIRATSAAAGPDKSVLYTFLYRAESGTAQDIMKAKLELLMRNARVEQVPVSDRAR
jgi:serine protease Do